ncbi:MAG TPA: DNA-binding protein [Saprospiraceae bacterium]|nr:DNA-binding protein [Saprospiraceae bacterium]
MNITFDELRDIKHRLPAGSIKRIADELNLDEQVVRNYFGAHHLENSGNHIQPGPHGGIVHIEDESILKLAMQILQESSSN